MQDKEAIEILKKLPEKYPLSEHEQLAVRTAIGILAWSKLLEGHINSKKRRRDAKLGENEE